MRIVDTLKARNHLTAVHDPASEDERQARRERQAAQHAQAVVSMMDEIPRRELDFDALGGRVIEHVASADGDYYRPFGGDPAFTGDDVTKYYVAQDGIVHHAGALHKPVQPRRSRTDAGEEAAAPARAAGRGQGQVPAAEKDSPVNWQYTARLVPLDVQVSVPSKPDREPWHYTFTTETFAREKGSKRVIPVCDDHQRHKVIGKVDRLIAQLGWWECEFNLDPGQDELERGSPSQSDCKPSGSAATPRSSPRSALSREGPSTAQ